MVDAGRFAASATKMTYAAWTKVSAALLLSAHAAAERLDVDDVLRAEWAISHPDLAERLASAQRSATAKGWRWEAEMREIAATFEAAELPAGFGDSAADVFGGFPVRPDQAPLARLAPMPGVNAEFLALPLTTLADAALSRAREIGAEYAALRVVSTRGQYLALQDLDLETSITSDDTGLAVRVVHDGCWGFAAGIVLSPEEAARLAERAVAVARASRPVSTERVVLADEPAYPDRQWSSPYAIDPFDVPDSEKVATLLDLTERLRPGTASRIPGPASRRSARTSSTPTSPAPPRPRPGSASSPSSRRRRSTARPARSRRCGRSRRRRRPGGSTSPAATPTSPARSPRSPSCSPPRSRRRRSAPATTTSSSTGPTSS